MSSNKDIPEPASGRPVALSGPIPPDQRPEEDSGQPLHCTPPAMAMHECTSSPSTITTSSSSACTTPSPRHEHLAPTRTANSARKTMACEMCNNYEIQLQDVQCRETVLNLQIGQHEKSIKQLRDELKKEQSFRRDLEDKYNEEAKQSEKQIRQLAAQVEESRGCIEKLSANLNSSEKRANDLVSDLIGQIERLKREINRLSADNDKLLGKHMKKSRDLLSESISLPQEAEQLEFYCLKLREDLIETLASKEHIEEDLKSKLMFFKEQVEGLMQSKNSMEESFTQEREMLRSKCEMRQVELYDSQVTLHELQKEHELLKEKHTILSAESAQKIGSTTSQLEELSAFKAKADIDMCELRKKVQSLQVELDNNEAVQRDFVKLSQSLQVQLEKIRQEDTDVRWQHEEDALECNSCKKTFTSRKEKINCSHCGRIFCPECTSKIVFSGPKRRPFKVCNVCHTLLDKQTACWFVNEAPNSPS